MAQLRQERIEEASDYFMHAPLGSGDIAQLVELRSCNWVVGNGEEDRNVPLKDSTETKMGCQERRGGRMGSWSGSSMDRTWTHLGWHSLKSEGEVQTRKGLRWIPRHPEMRKGVVIDEKLRGGENKHRSGDSRIGQPSNCC
ncbi:hypothetical protein HAX54_033060 [Datura stramonium]|uniref:Uncharacterized protein n=1 Tax=Datura stramonium TaxID=4076 RepID=A0ABS8VCP3_DATST|nr:hypothetical protein [Datura stramonium]